MSFEKGPYLEVLKKPQAVAGAIECTCKRRRPVKVNKSGWLYWDCYGATGCMRNETTRGADHATELVEKFISFTPRLKKKIQICAGLKQPVETDEGEELETTDEHEFVELEDLEAAMEAKTYPEPATPQKKKNLVTFKLFGKPL